VEPQDGVHKVPIPAGCIQKDEGRAFSLVRYLENSSFVKSFFFVEEADCDSIKECGKSFLRENYSPRPTGS
jgi:hypothetical protein